MKVSGVTEHDGVMFASTMQILAIADKLFDALKLAGLRVDGPGMDKRNEVAKWLREHSFLLAESLKSERAAGSQMKIKAMGPLKTSKKKEKR